MSFSEDFLQGQRDCINGKQHEAGKGEGYNRGYGSQYESDQITTEMNIKQDERRGIYGS